MKTRYRILSISLFIVMIFSSVCVFAIDTESEDYKDGYQDGEVKGKADGKAVGAIDARDNSDNYDKALDEGLKIVKDKLEGKKSPEYIDGFEEGYKKGFKEGYAEVNKSRDSEDSIIKNYGKDFGKLMGEADGYADYKAGKKSDWEKAIPSDSRLISLFELKLETADNREIFIESFKEEYKLAYIDAFQQAKFGGIKDSYEGGKSDGEKYAKLIAEKNAMQDYFKGLTNDCKRSMQTESEIITECNLSNDTDEYRDGFLAAYCEHYELYYMRKYRDLSLKDVENKYVPDENGYENGGAVGLLKGEYAAIMDIMSRKSNDWERHKVEDSILINEYGLDFQSENYRLAFIMGYWDSFLSSYNETYKEQAQEQNTTKTITEKVPIDGGKIFSSDERFYVEIAPGTYYDDVAVTIDTVPKMNVSATSTRHTKASNYYHLKLLNMDRTYDDAKEKKITIGFKFYGKDSKYGISKYGIYKYHFNKWIYIPSKCEEGFITAEINIANLNEYGNIYVVRVDNELPNFYDIRGHWAKDETITYTKREVVYGYPDDTFKPDDNITRREFVTMLSRLYDWYPPYDSSNVNKFKDYKEFGYAEKAISYATYYGIVNGYSDNTFRPHNPISYKEVETIMAKVLNTTKFKWNDFADLMMYENGVRSKSKDSMNNKITRAEFVFMLQRLNEWQY